MSSQVNALTKHVGEDAAAGISAVCSLADGAEIKNFCEDAGFTDVNHFAVDLTLRYPDGREFIKNGILSTPVERFISDWTEDERHELVDESIVGFWKLLRRKIADVSSRFQCRFRDKGLVERKAPNAPRELPESN